MPSATALGTREAPSIQSPAPDNGYFAFSDPPSEGGEFEFGPKNPGVDPPLRQAQIARTVRELYGWCGKYIANDEQCSGYFKALRQALYQGAVSEPANPSYAETLLVDIIRDLLSDANLLLQQRAVRALTITLIVTLTLGGFGALCNSVGTLFTWVSNYNSTFTTVGNYVLVACGAAAALFVSFVSGLARPQVTDLASFEPQFARYDYPFFMTVSHVFLALAAAGCLQNGWITLAVGGQLIDIKTNSLTALLIGFIFGLIGTTQLLQFLTRMTERMLPAKSRSSHSAQDAQAKKLGVA